MDFLKQIKEAIFHKTKPAAPEIAPEQYEAIRFNIVVIEFSDSVESRSGEIIAEKMRQKEGLNVSYFDEQFPKTFLNLDTRSLFDFIDKGQTILDKTMADVLIWGYREGEKIRINFQNNNQYEKEDNAFISLMDCFYIPADITDRKDELPEALGNLIYGAIISTINPKDQISRIRKKFLLKKIIDKLSQDNSAKTLSIEYMPYIMNLLGIIYLSYAYDKGDDKDYKIVKNLFETAIKHQDLIKNPIHLGCIYNHLGQLYDCAGEHTSRRPDSYFKNAIHYYQQAQKYLSKYNYPYDYGYISYKLSKLFFNYWRQKEDIQALRDAVFQLREAEKIYTYALFPEFWANIQGDLAHMLAILGNFSHSEDISKLAVSCYKNRQKVITERRDPLSWARIQESIGEIYYRMGKNNAQRSLLEESLEYFHDALYIYENMNLAEDCKKITTSIAKAEQNLNLL